jgi:hypothetical protein
MDESFETPNTDPGNETVVSGNTEFVDACLRLASEKVERLGWILGESTLTRSDSWGLVWRVHVATKRTLPDPQFQSRYICWGDPSGEVLGTKFAPIKRW